MSNGICYAWEKGTCERGDTCRFAHVGESGGNPHNPDAELGMMKRCHRFARSGECKFGDECKFAHVETPPRAPREEGAPRAEEDRAPRKRNRKSKGGALGGEFAGVGKAAGSGGLCYTYYRTGECKHGEGCKFEHTRLLADDEAAGLPPAIDMSRPLRTEGEEGGKVDAVCFRWLRGGEEACKFGGECRFNHYDKKQQQA
mmetsp:Transcript_69881/g.145714  ORF Transcript_69881/g.145714 Transcript_69881/m.145714 type:complete len:200 (-) Transcript_69881:92-691(-)